MEVLKTLVRASLVTSDVRQKRVRSAQHKPRTFTVIASLLTAMDLQSSRYPAF